MLKTTLEYVTLSAAKLLCTPRHQTRKCDISKFEDLAFAPRANVAIERFAKATAMSRHA